MGAREMVCESDGDGKPLKSCSFHAYSLLIGHRYSESYLGYSTHLFKVLTFPVAGPRIFLPLPSSRHRENASIHRPLFHPSLHIMSFPYVRFTLVITVYRHTSRSPIPSFSSVGRFVITHVLQMCTSWILHGYLNFTPAML